MSNTTYNNNYWCRPGSTEQSPSGRQRHPHVDSAAIEPTVNMRCAWGQHNTTKRRRHDSHQMSSRHHSFNKNVTTPQLASLHGLPPNWAKKCYITGGKNAKRPNGTYFARPRGGAYIIWPGKCSLGTRIATFRCHTNRSVKLPSFRHFQDRFLTTNRKNRKWAEYCFESTVSEKRTHWASLSLTANSVSFVKNSVSSLWHTNSRLRGTH